MLNLNGNILVYLMLVYENMSLVDINPTCKIYNILIIK
jgi:hypothetical protein